MRMEIYNTNFGINVKMDTVTLRNFVLGGNLGNYDADMLKTLLNNAVESFRKCGFNVPSLADAKFANEDNKIVVQFPI